jgi:hypothetical protein
MRLRDLIAVATIALLTSCQSQSAAGKQLDLNLLDTTGVGPATFSLSLPHARYTVFSYADPPPCVKAVQLRDSHGRTVFSDAAMRGGIPPPGVRLSQMVPTAVQQELSAGRYSLAIRRRTPAVHG